MTDTVNWLGKAMLCYVAAIVTMRHGMECGIHVATRCVEWDSMMDMGELENTHTPPRTPQHLVAKNAVTNFPKYTSFPVIKRSLTKLF